VILRIWHGYTTPEKADRYEALLKEEIFHGIESKALPGFSGIELLRRDLAGEVEFITVMRFASIDDVRAFTGEDYETAYVPDAAKQILKRFDERSQHYQLRESRSYTDTTEAGRLAAAIGREADA
jgi:heme-degrading monooxygenase HmoA